MKKLKTTDLREIVNKINEVVDYLNNLPSSTINNLPIMSSIDGRLTNDFENADFVTCENIQQCLVFLQLMKEDELVKHSALASIDFTDAAALLGTWKYESKTYKKISLN